MKLLGSLLILCASVCSCYFYEKSEREKIKNLTDIYEFIEYIKSQIQYFLSPISKIVKSYDSHNEIFIALANKNFERAKKVFSNEDYELIVSFFSSFGKCMKNEAVSLCEYTLTELEKSIQKKQNDYPNKIKSFRAISLFLGICFLILIV